MDADSSAAYLLPCDDSARQIGHMSRDRSAKPESQPGLEGSATWERIDALAKRKKVTTQQLADAAGVTWAAAKRWRQAKGKGGSEPTGENLTAIAGALGVTTDELLRIYDGFEPPFESWASFKQSAAYERLSPSQRTRVASHPWDEGEEPTLASWLALAEAHASAKKI